MSYLEKLKRLEQAKPKAEQQAAADPVWSDPDIVSTHIEDGEIIAIEICSKVLEAHIWLAFDDGFDPGDGQAVFYADELPFLKTKTPEQLKKIHALKLGKVGLGTRVRQ